MCMNEGRLSSNLGSSISILRDNTSTQYLCPTSPVIRSTHTFDRDKDGCVYVVILME